MKRTAVLNVVGLTRSLLGQDTPNLNRLAQASAPINTVTPAVTCSAQSTFLTGLLPREHGVVANGWYFRDLSEVWLWRQSNRLVGGDKIWHLGRARDPGFTCGNLFWWYNMVTDADWSVTPRPLYLADGRKLPDCYSDPPELRAALTERHGLFPLFQFWGPMTTIAASQWIAESAMLVEERHQPTLTLVYLPHLDYVLQRVGPQGDLGADLREIDAVCGRLLDFYEERGCRVVVLSEYGITQVSGAVHPNRLLRQAGLLEVKEDLGREYLDTGRCRAFAVADHQIAHVYIRDAADIPRVKALFAEESGVDRVLDEAGKREFGLDHPRSGELVLLSRTDTWFTYYFWMDDANAPDYARTVNIHAKPGYDPCELFIDPAIALPKLKVGWTLLKKTLGFRYMMDVTPLDPDLVKGSHGRTTDDDDQKPVFMTTAPELMDASCLEATEVCGRLLDHVFRS